MNNPVSFEISKLLKEKEINIESISFYTKPNSKMFGIDEKGRSYSIKNTPKKLYTCGEHAVLNRQNIHFAPTIAEVIMWLYETHEIWISVDRHFDKFISKNNGVIINFYGNRESYFDTPTEAYSSAIEYVLNKII